MRHAVVDRDVTAEVDRCIFLLERQHAGVHRSFRHDLVAAPRVRIDLPKAVVEDGERVLAIVGQIDMLSRRQFWRQRARVDLDEENGPTA